VRAHERESQGKRLGSPIRDDVLPLGALALVVAVFAVAELRVLGLETGVDDVVGSASGRGLGHGGRGQDGEGEQEGLHIELNVVHKNAKWDRSGKTGVG